MMALENKDLMDLETENRIAAILLKEAAELRREAEKEGVHAYLQRPTVRFRPNSRFLTATVLGTQQANRVVEENEMWQIRQKELELDDRPKGRSRLENRNDKNTIGNDNYWRSTQKKPAMDDKGSASSCPSGQRAFESCNSTEDEGLRDEEIEEFLQSRVKRGRGAVGSRMDETGPYLPPFRELTENLSTSWDVREHRVVKGPEKPSSLKSYESSEEELDEKNRKKARKDHSRSSHKKHSKKLRLKEKSRDNRKKERRSRH